MLNGAITILQVLTGIIPDCIYVKVPKGSPGTWIWIGFDGNIFSLHEALKAKAVTIKLPPTNFSWAYEMHIQDPDGHVLRFGTDPDEKTPFADK